MLNNRCIECLYNTCFAKIWRTKIVVVVAQDKILILYAIVGINLIHYIIVNIVK